MRMIEIQEILDKISYLRADGEYVHFSFFFLPEMYLQVSAMADDTDTGIKCRQRGRKWKLSQFMTKTEIVRVAWNAVQAFEFHEMQERFKYKGKAIFNSHIDADALAGISDKIDARDPVLMEEV